MSENQQTYRTPMPPMHQQQQQQNYPPQPWTPPQTTTYPSNSFQGVNNSNNNNVSMNMNMNNNSNIQMNQMGNMSNMGGDELFRTVASNPLTTASIKYGQEMIHSKMSVIRYFTINRLRYYFQVDNSYVIKKFKILMFPFVHKNWRREEHDYVGANGQQSREWRSPKDDVNAPDLYIPTMAFITYILTYGLALGLFHRFTPEVLGLTASTALLMLFLEILLMKFVFYIMGDVLIQPALLDLCAYSSYKYVGVIVDLLVGIMLGSWMMTFATLITGFSLALFMIRTLNKVTSTGLTPSQDDASRRNYLLLSLGAVQILMSFFLVRNAIPSS